MSRPLPVLLCATVLLLAGCGQGRPPESASPHPPADSPGPSTMPGQEWTRVPPVELGWSVERAVRRLARAGLVGERPDVDWPHYAAGTDPAAGTRVEVGSSVRILPGDG